jgi:hypothetical protein
MRTEGEDERGLFNNKNRVNASKWRMGNCSTRSASCAASARSPWQRMTFFPSTVIPCVGAVMLLARLYPHLLSLPLPTSPYLSLPLPTSPYLSLPLPTSPYRSLPLPTEYPLLISLYMCKMQECHNRRCSASRQ